MRKNTDKMMTVQPNVVVETRNEVRENKSHRDD